jgi:hypothetical protein
LRHSFASWHHHDHLHLGCAVTAAVQGAFEPGLAIFLAEDCRHTVRIVAAIVYVGETRMTLSAIG